jgi:prepilin-type N-terminal cleavage/methylation domain-containing protein
MKAKTGFTLTELMLAVVIVGLLAAFAVPNFNKAILKNEERQAGLQLKSLYARNLIEMKRTGEYVSGSDEKLSPVFGINPGQSTYSYCGAASSFYARAAGSGNSFEIQVTDRNEEPCCCAGKTCLVTPTACTTNCVNGCP